MKSTVQVLLKMFEHEAEQALFVLKTANDSMLEYSPGQGLRNLKTLANHLAQIPSMDPRLYMGEIADSNQAGVWEKEHNCNSIDEMSDLFREGIEYLQGIFNGMKDTDFLESKLKPFYTEGETKAWDYYLPEIITHISMHKMQLWMYLKLAGADVNMMTYYGVPT